MAGTATRDRFEAGVLPYVDMGYSEPDHVPNDTDILCAFRVAPRPACPVRKPQGPSPGRRPPRPGRSCGPTGSPPRDPPGALLQDRERAGRRHAVHRLRRVRDRPVQEGSIANLASSIIGNVFGFKAVSALRLEDMYIPPAYLKTFPGPPHGIQVERDRLGKYGRPLLGCMIKPKLGLSPHNYGREVYEALRGGLDFTRDDENINSQPFMHWRDRYLNAMEAVNKAMAITGEVKGHYLNTTAATMEDMHERAGSPRSSAARSS